METREEIIYRKQTMSEKIDYDFGFTKYLSVGDAVSTFQLTTTPATGLTVGSIQSSNTLKIWCGPATVAATYSIKCKMTSLNGGIEIKTLMLTVEAD